MPTSTSGGNDDGSGDGGGAAGSPAPPPSPPPGARLAAEASDVDGSAVDGDGDAPRGLGEADADDGVVRPVAVARDRAERSAGEPDRSAAAPATDPLQRRVEAYLLGRRTTARCRGPCGEVLRKDGFAADQWTLVPVGGTCLKCARVRRRRRRRTASPRPAAGRGVGGGGSGPPPLPRRPKADGPVPPPPKKRPRAAAAAARGGDDGSPSSPPPLLPLAPPPRDRNGLSPRRSRVRSCMCPCPSLCRELMWRRSRLPPGSIEGEVSYLRVPRPSRHRTPVGERVNAYRAALMRRLGYDGGDAGGRKKATRTVMSGKRTKTTEYRAGLEECLAVVHFHPEVRPYAFPSASERGKGAGNKLNKWLVPAEVGRRAGLTEEDKCPGHDGRYYFAVPTYSIQEATRDVERAEADYLRSRDRNEELAADIAANVHDYVVEIHDLRRQNARLEDENLSLRELLRREVAARDEAGGRSGRALQDLERASWLVERRGDAGETGLAQDRGDVNAGRGAPVDKREGRRWGDARMDRAVEARVGDPKLSAEEALRIGGFVFPEAGKEKMGDVVDADGISLQQRKNILAKRLRVRKRMLKREAADRAAAWGGDRGDVDAGGGEPVDKRGGRRWGDARMDRAVEARVGDPNLSAEEALWIGGFVFPEAGKETKGDVVDADGISLQQRKNNLARRLRVRKRMLKREAADGAVARGERVVEEAGGTETNDPNMMSYDQDC